MSDDSTQIAYRMQLVREFARRGHLDQVSEQLAEALDDIAYHREKGLSWKYGADTLLGGLLELLEVLHDNDVTSEIQRTYEMFLDALDGSGSSTIADIGPTAISTVRATDLDASSLADILWEQRKFVDERELDDLAGAVSNHVDLGEILPVLEEIDDTTYLTRAVQKVGGYGCPGNRK